MSIENQDKIAYHKDKPEHVYDYYPDCDICSGCKEHTVFCSCCHESECCGEPPYDVDYEPRERD